jgi:hypothetical protein
MWPTRDTSKTQKQHTIDQIYLFLQCQWTNQWTNDIKSINDDGSKINNKGSSQSIPIPSKKVGNQMFYLVFRPLPRTKNYKLYIVYDQAHGIKQLPLTHPGI